MIRDLLRQEIDNCIFLASYISILITKEQITNNNKPLIGIFFQKQNQAFDLKTFGVF